MTPEREDPGPTQPITRRASGVWRRPARYIPAIVALWVCVLSVVIGMSPRARAGSPAAVAQASQDPAYVGSETCAGCHQEQFESYRHSVHAQTESGDWAVTGCESCHGPGADHVEDPLNVMVLFDPDDTTRTVSEKTGQCLGCHVQDAATFEYRSGSHMKGAIDCAACHKPHAAAGRDRLLTGAQTEACLGCHQEVRAALNLNERHRVLEGVVACADCHTQHGVSARDRLGGFKQETCTGCHTDKSGPFVFEHVSSRVDGCTSCHLPHGSVNRHMLDFQSPGDLCYSCHVVVPGFHRGFGPPGIPARFDSTTNCTNCHATIHGSNLDPHFLR